MLNLANESGSALFEQSAEAVFVLDHAGIIWRSNGHLADLLGRPAAALPGTPLFDCLSPGEADLLEPLLARAAAGEILRTTAWVPGPDGPRELRLRLGPVLTDMGGSNGVWGLARLLNVSLPQDDGVLMDLVERERQLSLFFNSISDVTFALDLEADHRYRFTFANRAFKKSTGLDPQQVVGRYVDEVIPEPSLSLVLQKYDEAVATGEQVKWQETTDYPSGRVVGEVCIAPVQNARGGQQLVGIVHDLTAQKCIEEDLRRSNERFSYALKATTDAIYEWAVATDMLYWGEGFEELFGHSITQNPAPFQEWAVYVHPADRSRVVEGLRRKMLETQELYWQEEYRFRRADGSWAFVFDRGYLLRDATGQPVRMIGAMQDITARQRAAAEQQRLTEQLTNQNADLQQFAYMVSHNLRAPLANALGFSALLAQVDKHSEVFDTSLGNLHTSLRQLDQVLTDMNDVLALRDADGYYPEPVPVAEVSRQAAENLRETLQAVGGQLDIAIPEALRLPGSRAYFHSIFHNLLSNAIKYRAAARPLRVRFGAASGPDGTTITVEDNGVGFDQARIGDEIFHLYRRFHPDKSGRGIGLYLVRAHTEAMGGRVAVRSQPDDGARFTLSFWPPADENLLN
ncbi:MAG: PAS domain S-box protein [Bacteroidota bacterium]|nr:PAS domain S-box protein [Bacteroidota bacterium]